jgi:hypothetical protein
MANIQRAYTPRIRAKTLVRASCDRDLVEALKAEAKERQVSFSGLLERAIYHYLMAELGRYARRLHGGGK